MQNNKAPLSDFKPKTRQELIDKWGFPGYCYPEIEDGWVPLVDELCEKLYNVGFTDFSHVSQIKEKYGGLRFYVDFSTKEQEDLISLYENKSLTICEDCGKVGKLRSGSWIKCRCNDCQKDHLNWLKSKNLVK